MTGAMFAAMSGLQSHMDKLNVIGNNIANVNTYTYKPGRTVFQTSIYTTLINGSNGTTTIGGRNPSQIGYGTQIGSIDLDMGTGTYAPTGNPTHSMIDGDGFYLVGNKELTDQIHPNNSESLKGVTLTRLGNFEFKADGYLSDAAGNVVYGFLCTGVADDGKTPVVSDQLVPIRFPRKSPTGSVLYPKVEGDKLIDDVENPVDPDGPPNPMAQFDSITIDSKTGKISGINKDTGELTVIGFMAIGNVTNPNGVTQMGGPYYKAGDGAGDLTVSLMGGVAKDVTTTKDGTGKLEHVNQSRYPNEQPVPGMMIGNGGTTQLLTAGLEMSKTNLATEISEMITTQRGYQANTRIITVTDAMLEELVNIKR